MGDFTQRRSDQSGLVGVGGGRGARGDAELGEHVAHVAVHGALAEHELGGDRLVGLAGGNQPQDPQLALAEAMGIAGRAARERADPHEEDDDKCSRAPAVTVIGAGRMSATISSIVGGSTGERMPLLCGGRSP